MPPSPARGCTGSGDLARWTEDGELEFVGRADHQVKVRGFRVELAEVEAALEAADGVGAAAARMWEIPGSSTLAGYVVPQQSLADEAQKAAFAGSVRAAVASTLPGYMVPSSLTVLDVLPKTDSGKLNRPGLPRPAVSTTGATEPPRTDTERALATVFAELLSTAQVGRFDDFFTLGGDSILSVQLAARKRARPVSRRTRAWCLRKAPPCSSWPLRWMPSARMPLCPSRPPSRPTPASSR